MNIPGVNLLALAQTAIGSQIAQLYAYTSRTSNAIGQYVTVFADPVNISGSFQPVPRQKYAELGLDFTKTYAWFYSSAQILDVARDRSGDQIAFGGKRWEVSGNNDWKAIDGWNGVLLVAVTSP
jgi:hypothetical protein